MTVTTTSDVTHSTQPPAAASATRRGAARETPRAPGGGGPGSDPAAQAVTFSSPQTPAPAFSALVGQLRGSPGSQGEVLRSLQQGFGNQFTGQVLASPQAAVPPAAVEAPGPLPPGGAGQPGAAVELKGAPDFAPPAATDQALQAAGQQGGDVPVQFGRIAQGRLRVRRGGSRSRARYWASAQALEINHPVLQPLKTAGLDLRLMVAIQDSQITGHIGLTGRKNLHQAIHEAPELLGLAGLELGRSVELVNQLNAGKLRFGLKNAAISIASVFSGQVTLLLIDEDISFNGSFEIQKVKGLDHGSLTLTRSPEGEVSGNGELEVTLGKKFSGKMQLSWKGDMVRGVATVSYAGEKLSGTVTIYFMEQEQADSMLAERQAAATAAPDAVKAPKTEAPAAGASRKPRPQRRPHYVAAGEGNLNYTFNEWLAGNAQVVVDPEGYITVIGKIKPREVVPLFPVRPYRKPFPPFRARAVYGLPVVADIYVEAGIGITLWANLGPGVLRDAEVDGTYSTDPKVRNDFRLTGVIHIQASAGVDLDAYGKAGLEILDHDISVRADLIGTLGIRGYLQVKPTIGYREEGEPGADRHGVFFMSGAMLIVAQPFLGLSGSISVGLVTPWWSPISDRTWHWPLGSKEWQLGGGIGIGANVDYVFGSGQTPELSLSEPSFDGDQFIDDLVEDRAPEKQAREGEKTGTWKEKLKPGDAPPPPPPASPKAGLTPGGRGPAPARRAEEPAPAKQQAKRKRAPGPEIKSPGPAGVERDLAHQETPSKSARTAPPRGKPKTQQTDPQAAAPKEDAVPPTHADPEQRWERGVRVVRQALQYADANGIELIELNRILKSIQRRREFGFLELYAVDAEEDWIVFGSMSPARKVTTVKKKRPAQKAKPAAAAAAAAPLGAEAAAPLGAEAAEMAHSEPTKEAAKEPKPHPAAPAKGATPEVKPPPLEPAKEGDKEKKAPEHITLRIPSFKGIHLSRYRALAREGRLIGRADYERETDAQREKWDRALMPGRGEFAMYSEIYQEGVDLNLGPQVPEPGNRNWILRPNWAPDGERMPMQVDHVFELQVLRSQDLDWADSPANYELLDGHSNSSSGTRVKNNILAERENLVRETNDPSWRRRDLLFDRVEVAPGGPGKRWLPHEIQTGDHLEVYKKALNEPHDGSD